jgi:carnitine O-acetyltransferase
MPTRETAQTVEEPVASTFGNEGRLQRVPLPTLEETCERFLVWCSPLLTAGELAETERAVASFVQSGTARQLHAALAEYDARENVHSWLDAFWSSRYLGRRDRIALNANYFFLFHDSRLGQIERAAELIAAAVDYKLTLDEERVPPVVHNGRALSMEQHRFLFSTTRIPGGIQDTVRAPYSETWPGPSQERHIAVFFRGRIVQMDVIRADGSPHSPDELGAGLRAVMTAVDSRVESDECVGHLTTMPRAGWARCRRALLDAHAGNAEVLDVVERALFCVCMEEIVPRDVLDACDHLLHGDSGNRWFDKALSFIVFGDGTAGLNVEHSGLDGTTVVSFLDTLLGPSASARSRHPRTRFQSPPFAAITFELDAELRAAVGDAALSFAEAAAETATAVLSLEDFGSDHVKELRASPDAFVQMVFQLAHKRARGLVGATYEAISTRHFHHGRTEAMRVVTPESVHFVNAMAYPRADETARRSAFRAAAEKHVQRAKECQAGLAPEQHLWELQLIQRRRGTELGVPEPLALYETPGWLKMRDDYLSTSSTPSANVRYGGFGPTGSKCIGIGYMLLSKRFDLHLSAVRPIAREMHVFMDELRETIRELQDLLASDR